jgi:predicted LPLAT superfamily acyltransferase
MNGHAGPQARAGWLDVVERGSVLGIRFFVWLSTAFGRSPARFVLRFVALYYVLFDRTVRRASGNYWARVGGRATFALVYAHVLRFAECALDRLFFVCGKDARFEVNRTGSHFLQELHESGRGAILLGAHLGSFEALRMQAVKSDFRVNILGYFRNARMINAALEKLNPHTMTRLIPIDGAGVDFVLRIKARIERGECIGVLGDRIVLRGEHQRTASVEFLGGKALFPTGVYQLASMLKCPIYLTFALYRSPNRYDLYCEPFERSIELPRTDRERALSAYAQKFAARLEHFVRLAPDNWFNFFDFWVES